MRARSSTCVERSWLIVICKRWYWSALVITLPPVMVVVLMQRWFVKGLVDTEK